MTRTTSSSGPRPTIEVRCDRPGVVLAIDGPLDDRTSDLLDEVVRAALLVVRRAHRIHVDLSRARLGGGPVPRILRQLERAGATVTRAGDGAFAAVGRAR